MSVIDLLVLVCRLLNGCNSVVGIYPGGARDCLDVIGN